MDQAPGPIIATLMPRPANMIAIDCVPGWVKAIHTSTIPASIPTTGVHRPPRIRRPAAAPPICSTTSPVEVPRLVAAIPLLIRALPASRRNNRIPPPGQPSAKVENSRCKVSRLKGKKFAAGREDPKRGSGTPTFVLLQFDNSSLQPDRHGMCAVVRPQLREDIRHVPFNGVLSELELRCDLLVRVPRGDQPRASQFRAPSTRLRRYVRPNRKLHRRESAFAPHVPLGWSPAVLY